MERDCLLVFVKRPRAGEAKTRLIPQLGAAAAAELYRALAEAEIDGTAPQPGEYRRLLCFAPAASGEELRAWLPGEEWLPQRGADLGERMAAAFEEAFRRGSRRAVLIGSDAPWLSREQVLEALVALETHEVVLVPARDGGYCLIALERPRPELFQGVSWSSPSVLVQTLERARASGLRVRLLQAQADIDTLQDLRAEWPRLRPLLAARTALVEAIERALCG